VNYSKLTQDYFDAAEALAGTLADPGACRGAAGSRAHGTWVQFDVQFTRQGAQQQERAPTIQSVRFLAYACPHIIAAAAWITEQSVGVNARAALPESVSDLRERFSIPVEKLGRLLIVEDAWIAAIKACLGSAAR
jgi:NifU-like protein involved in Fe-S cluster formation